MSLSRGLILVGSRNQLSPEIRRLGVMTADNYFLSAVRSETRWRRSLAGMHRSRQAGGHTSQGLSDDRRHWQAVQREGRASRGPQAHQRLSRAGQNGAATRGSKVSALVVTVRRY